MINQSSNDEDSLREHLGKLLQWGDAHIDFNRATDEIPAELQGVRPDGLP